MYYGFQSSFKNLKSQHEFNSSNLHFGAAYWLYLRFASLILCFLQGYWGYFRVNYRSNGHPIVDLEGTKILNDEALTQAIVSGTLNHL